MEYILDNPIYNGMISGNRHLSTGTESVRYYPKEISPFVGLKSFDKDSFSLLADLLPPNHVSVMITAADPKVPSDWKIIRQSLLLQLVAENPEKPVNIPEHIIPLLPKHIPQMLELTKMTNPGPFAVRTIEFGHYHGIFQDDQLVAMAGYRMQPYNHIEISAVCTHPDYTGKGYGSALTLYQAGQIVKSGKIPFLQAHMDNENAIRVYKKSGFVARCEMHLNVFQYNK